MADPFTTAQLPRRLAEAARAAAEFESALAGVAIALERDPESLRQELLDWIKTTPLSLPQGIEIVRRRGEVPPPR